MCDIPLTQDGIKDGLHIASKIGGAIWKLSAPERNSPVPEDVNDEDHIIDDRAEFEKHQRENDCCDIKDAIGALVQVLSVIKRWHKTSKDAVVAQRRARAVKLDSTIKRSKERHEKPKAAKKAVPVKRAKKEPVKKEVVKRRPKMGGFSRTAY